MTSPLEFPPIFALILCVISIAIHSLANRPINKLIKGECDNETNKNSAQKNFNDISFDASIAILSLNVIIITLYLLSISNLSVIESWKNIFLICIGIYSIVMLIFSTMFYTVSKKIKDNKKCDITQKIPNITNVTLILNIVLPVILLVINFIVLYI